MVKWMTDANNASNVISEVKRTPLAAMTHLLISTKGALRRPITYITAVKRHCTDGVTKCPKTLQIMPLGMISSLEEEKYIPGHIIKLFHFALSEIAVKFLKIKINDHLIF